MTAALLTYYQKYPFIFDYFDFLRDLFLFIQIFLVIGFIFYFRKFRYLLHYLILFFLGFVLATFFKTFFPTPRPIGGFDSFPSRHTLISTVLSFALINQNFKLGIFSLGLTILIALLSVLSLRHWFIDVLAGFVFGLLLVFCFYKILNFFNRFNSNKRQSKF